jgi:hypothetical protein
VVDSKFQAPTISFCATSAAIRNACLNGARSEPFSSKPSPKPVSNHHMYLFICSNDVGNCTLLQICVSKKFRNCRKFCPEISNTRAESLYESLYKLGITSNFEIPFKFVELISLSISHWDQHHQLAGLSP